VLVLATLGAPGPPRRRRRPWSAEPEATPASLPLTRVTAIRASAPFGSAEEAAAWLDEATEADDTVDVLLADALGLLNQALHVRAVAAGDPRSERSVSVERAAAARIGFGSGEETAAGRFADAREIDLHGRSGGSRRRQREEELRPQSRLAAVLGGRERLDVCETMLLRARVDHDAGRDREAALQLRAGLEAMRFESQDGAGDPGHESDMAELEERRPAVEAAADAAVRRELDAEEGQTVAAGLRLAERILRRRRVLGD
jgi:hypothetical protein